MYDKNNVFYKILHGVIPCKKVFENDVALAFYDLNPVCKVHVLVICKKECRNLEEFVKETSADEIKLYFKTVTSIAEKTLNLKKSGYRVLTNTGDDAGQEIQHFHMHILGGESLKSVL
ncbi:MAG: HIT domain-containing protein [Alphaproteobacteria bacterium]|nr:HIT domain-containing protein [Alphaproteobacteria bacterium]